jgi:phenylacetate-CoA ligase
MFEPAPRDPGQAHWDPERQTMSRDALRVLQDARVRALVGKIFDVPVRLFRRKLVEAGIEGPGDVTGLDDLQRIPLTVKQDLRDAEAAHPPFGDYRFTPASQCVRLGQSTGTTGTPTLSLFTRHDIWIEYESAARNWWRNGWRPGQVVTHAHPAYLYGGGVMLSGSLEYFGMLNVWVAPPDTDELAEQGLRMWQRVPPDVSMVAFSLGRFHEVAAALDMDVALPPFQMGGGGGKGLPLMTAGLECYAYVGGPCAQSAGAHLHEDCAEVQADDPATGRDVPDGAWGDLVVTTLDRDNGLLRYDLEEAAMIVREPCPCGETTIRGFWGGRFKDLLLSQGQRFFVADVEHALRTVDAVAKPSLEYQVIKPEPEGALEVRVELGDSAADRVDVAAECAAAIRGALDIDAVVEVIDRGTLPRSGYKATRLVDRQS